MVALDSLAKLERNEKGVSVGMPVKPLLERDIEGCREAASD